MASNLPTIKAFWLYVKSKWLPKTKMWVVGYHNLPRVEQDTNASIENYHVNLKQPSIHPRVGFIVNGLIGRYLY